jgi:hypothetical protein
VEGAPVSFGERFVLAFAVFFRVLFNAEFAARVKSASEGPLAALPSSEPPKPPPQENASERRREGALALLSLLQRDGRIVDFLQQDIASFSDADVGAAARVVHDGCRKALKSHFDVERVRPEPEGSPVTIPAGFDAAEVKLTGDVKGTAPYRGTLRHSGWRVNDVRLPERVAGHDAHDLWVVFPAEVEL